LQLGQVIFGLSIFALGLSSVLFGLTILSTGLSSVLFGLTFLSTGLSSALLIIVVRPLSIVGMKSSTGIAMRIRRRLE
jgi:hypothetical protein